MFSISLKKERDKLISIDITKIVANRAQPRRVFNREEMEALSQSIKENGLIQPISVRRMGDRYELIAGERRLIACRLAGLTEITAIVCEVDDQRSAVMALVENMQRQGLNFFEEAYAIRTLLKDYGLSQAEVADKLCMSQSAVANKLRILRLSEDEQKKLLAHGLTERHARALIRIDDEKTRGRALDHIISTGMTVSAAEEYITGILGARPRPKRSTCFIIKDIRLFTNTITKAVDTIKASGVDAILTKNEGESFIEYNIKVPI